LWLNYGLLLTFICNLEWYVNLSLIGDYLVSSSRIFKGIISSRTFVSQYWTYRGGIFLLSYNYFSPFVVSLCSDTLLYMCRELLFMFAFCC
jgi:hypothetical protein